MLTILRYLKKSLPTVALILGLLVVQAVCDLSLPSYTSGIVDVGIQQSGIETAVPSQIRASSLQALMMLMPEEEAAAVEAAYQLEQDGNLHRKNLSSAELESLNNAFRLPMALLSSVLENQEGLSVPLEGGAIQKEQLEAILSSAGASMEGMNESLLEQRAIGFVQREYAAMGMDLHAIQSRYLWSTGAKMLGVTVAMVAAAICTGFLSSRTAAGVGRDLRRQVFSKVLSFSGAELDHFSTASLITRSTNDIQQVQMVIVILLRMVLYAPILGIGGIIIVSGTNTGMSWIIAVAVGVILALVLILMNVAMPKFKKMQALVDRLNLVSREILTGLPVIRAFSREKREEERFDQANRDLMKTNLFTNRVMTFMMPCMMLIMNGISIAIVWFGAQGVDLGQLQVGDMIAFITYTMQIVMSFMMLTMVSIMLPRAKVAAQRIQEVLDTEPSIAGSQEDTEENLVQNGEIAFENVSFHFPGASGNVLTNITFTAKPGQTTAIIGSTGSGKSVLINLIPRFYDVTEGCIRLGGTDIRELPLKKLRGVLGYVPQKAVLFSGTIASNLKFGGDTIDDVQMRQAAGVAQATDFIQQKEEGFHSPIAQGGTNVSGGQKQRLSIARAIAKKPLVYLFDDSFSALDYKTDAALRRALHEITGQATVILVAQRISTILHADQIIVLDEGKIAGIGTHEQLLRHCEAYREIARSQLSESELGGAAQ